VNTGLCTRVISEFAIVYKYDFTKLKIVVVDFKIEIENRKDCFLMKKPVVAIF
jgi:hypothetical protein